VTLDHQIFTRWPAQYAVVALRCAMALRVGSNATYWADIIPPILLLALGMSLAIAPLTTLVLTSSSPIAPESRPA